MEVGRGSYIKFNIFRLLSDLENCFLFMQGNGGRGCLHWEGKMYASTNALLLSKQGRSDLLALATVLKV